MIEPLQGLPEGVLGYEVKGAIEVRDYTDVLLPAIEEAAAAGGVRLVLVFPAFEGMTGGAMWQDLRMGVGHLSAWKRTALVTDVEWMSHLVHLFGWMSPGEFRHFPMAEREAAIAWAAADG